MAERSEIEARLMELSEAVPVDKPVEVWVRGKELDDFVGGWFDLRAYYTFADDPDVGAAVVAEYVSMMRVLRRVMLNPELDNQIRELATDKLIELETVFEITMWRAVETLE